MSVSADRPVARGGSRIGISRAVLSHAVRVTVAAGLALILAKALGLRLPLWAVLTALIVTQMSVGRSLKAALDYLAGTFGGALYGGAVAGLIPHSTEISLLGVLALTLAPMAVLAALRPSMSAAPLTAIIVLLVPEMTHSSTFDSAVDRVLEVAVGGLTGFIVSLFVLPSSANKLLIEAAARTLDQMAQALETLLDGVTRGFGIDDLHRIQDGVGASLQGLMGLSVEAEHERSAGLARGPEAMLYVRSLLRIRHDIAMIGRALTAPMPVAFAARLQPKLVQVSQAYTHYLRQTAAALRREGAWPTLQPVDEARLAYEAEIQALRRDGLTRDLSADALERIFAIGFALEQLRSNFAALGGTSTDWTVR